MLNEDKLCAAIEALKGQRIFLDLPAVGVLLVLSNLQLALRHPLNTGPSSELARELARTFEAALGQYGLPEIAALARAGWGSELERLPTPKQVV